MQSIRYSATVFCLAAVTAQTPTSAFAQTPAAPMTAVAVTTLLGKSAPDFTLPDQNDKLHSLRDSRGKWTVVAFYPADMTTGCTFQNISYTRTTDKFAPLNAVVYTISTQDTASKKRFCTKDSLTHTLLSDVGGRTAQAYGVLNGSVARRVTFYVAPDGTIRDIDTAIRTQQAGEDSLVRLAKLEANPANGTEPRKASGGTPATTAESPAQFVGPTSLKVELDKAVPDFVLPDAATGNNIGFTTLSAGKKATVLVFMSTTCPVSTAYEARIQQLSAAYAPQGVQVEGIDANTNETPEMITAHAKSGSLTVPILVDASGKVADQFGARVTPEVFVINGSGVLVYRGAFDDSRDAAAVTHHYAKDAVDAVLAGHDVAVKQVHAVGCAIAR
jgi:peroxiredoxin Q/BCP